MGTQTAIATQIYNAKANYVCTQSQPPTLYGQVKDWFEQAQTQKFEGITLSYDERVEKGIIALKKTSLDCASF